MADVLGVGGAGHAMAANHYRLHGASLVDLEAGDAGPDLRDGAGKLVAERDGDAPAGHGVWCGRAKGRAAQILM